MIGGRDRQRPDALRCEEHPEVATLSDILRVEHEVDVLEKLELQEDDVGNLGFARAVDHVLVHVVGVEKLSHVRCISMLLCGESRADHIVSEEVLE